MCLALLYRQEKAVRSSRGTGLLLLLMEILLCNKEYLKPSAKPQSHANPPPKKEFLYRQKSALVRRGDGWHCWREIFLREKSKVPLSLVFLFVVSGKVQKKEKEERSRIFSEIQRDILPEVV